MIFGPSAVGKMAVGHELAAITGYKLFHNHLAAEPVADVFPWGSPPFGRLVFEFRRRVIEEAVAVDLPGLIFTFVWALEDPADKDYVDRLIAPVLKAGGRLDFVELYADQATRLAREGTALRLDHKRSKRDVEVSRERLRHDDLGHRLNTDGDFCYFDRHLKIDNTRLSPADAARRIASALSIPLV